MANTNIRLKIEKTATYCGRVVIPNDEITVCKADADKLVARKIASIVGKIADDENDEHVDDELDDMDVEELKEYAAEAGVSLKGLSEKADIIEAIRKAV